MDVHWQDRWQRIIRYMGLFMSIFLTITTSLLDSIVVKQPHHMSILTGEAWVVELLAGHPLYNSLSFYMLLQQDYRQGFLVNAFKDQTAQSHSV
jgi:hypothetical protein